MSNDKTEKNKDSKNIAFDKMQNIIKEEFGIAAKYIITIEPLFNEHNVENMTYSVAVGDYKSIIYLIQQIKDLFTRRRFKQLDDLGEK